MEYFVYVRTQGTTKCVDCGRLTGGIARHLPTVDTVKCLECHVDHEVAAMGAGWLR